MADIYQVQNISSMDEATEVKDTDVLLIGLESGTQFGKIKAQDLLKALSAPKVKRATVTLGDLMANTNKEITVNTDIDSSYTLLGVSVTPKGGIPFMVSVNNLSITSFKLDARSPVNATGRTADVLIFYN